MSIPIAARLPKWPFFLGDAILLALAGFYFRQGKLPFGHWELAFMLFATVCAAAFGVLPYIIEYRANEKLNESATLAAPFRQMQNLEKVAEQIAAATSQWQDIQSQAAKTTSAAKSVSEQMSSEAAAFTDFLRKANDEEKAHLRLELEKLRRSEGEWLQILVRMLDHVYALHYAGMRSGQPKLVEQLTNFQNACREVTRRVGLVPFAPIADEQFDPKRHEVPESSARPDENSRIEETIATGYTFQGQLLRPALVAIRSGVISADSATHSPSQAEQPAAPGTPQRIKEQVLL